MESYLVDSAVLGEFVDALISEKYPGQPASDHASEKESAISTLDQQILEAVLGTLTEEQGKELDQILDDENSSESAFEDFFKKHNIDLKQVVKDTMVKFKDDFLKGGENA